MAKEHRSSVTVERGEESVDGLDQVTNYSVNCLRTHRPLGPLFVGIMSPIRAVRAARA